VAEKIQAKLALGQFDIGEEKEPLPFRTFYKGWLDSYAKTHTKASTYAGYETSYRVHLLPFLGDTDIRDITRERLKRFMYEKLNAGLSRSSVRGYLAPLSEMFNHAIEDGHLDRNPCMRIMRTTRQEKGEQQSKVDFLTREEVAHLLDTCQQHFPVAYPFVLLLARTGLRLGEAVAVQWGDIDFNGRFINVHNNWVDGTLTTPKSGKARRVDMSRMLTETLTALEVARKKETLKNGWGEVPAWVFTSETGTILDPDNFRRRTWARLLAKAGLRSIRIHDLRHNCKSTVASLLPIH
jgi:integrase